MATYGIVADIHGNLEALASALAALDECGVDQLICLGDLVGYNADPDGCIRLLRQRNAVAIQGNHDLIGIGRLGFERCANKAAFALLRTRRTLQPESVRYLARLPHQWREPDGAFVAVHGTPGEVQEYLTTREQALRVASWLRREQPGSSVCFYGHTHQPRLLEVDGEEVRQHPGGGPLTLAGRGVWLINPGSVDAARRRGPKLAQFAVYDSTRRTVELRQAPYDEAYSEAKARLAGYRIDPLHEWLYTWRRRVGRRLIRWQRAGDGPAGCRPATEP